MVIYHDFWRIFEASRALSGHMIKLRLTQSNSADHVIKVMGSNPALAILFGRIFHIPS
jgi:hypothetical protein